MSKIKTVFIVGPTASGKTDLSIKVAKKFDGGIISADSMQIYKGIHIASAAPDECEKDGIPHHLLEFVDLKDKFSVAEYVSVARKCIDEITSRGKLPVIVGGTGLYIDSLVDNIQFTEEESKETLRKELEKEFDSVGAEEMLKRLSEFDPESALRLHPSNRRRIIRAFEVYRSTGVTFTEQNRLSRLVESPLDSLVIGITYKDRQKLYDRINRRVDLMIENGILDEAKATLKLDSGKGAAQAIGHKELYPYLNGECTLEEAIENLKMQTRRYAKRQLTWFGRRNEINWIYADECLSPFSEAEILIDKFLIEEA